MASSTFSDCALSDCATDGSDHEDSLAATIKIDVQIGLSGDAEIIEVKIDPDATIGHLVNEIKKA